MSSTTTRYVASGKKVTDHLGPINATMFLATGVLVPAMDFLRPRFPYMGHVAGAVALFFVVLLAMRWLKMPADRAVPAGLVLCAGVCAATFAVGAVVSSRHAAQGGFVAAASDEAKALQAGLLRLEAQTGEIRTTLKRIESGRSDDPRVELRNIGVEWSEDGLRRSSRIGDLRALELFLRGGMPIHSSGDAGRTSLAVAIIANDSPRMKEQLELLVRYGHGLDEARTVQARPDPAAPPNLHAYAKHIGNEQAARLLADMGADTSAYGQWKARQPKPVVLPGLL